MYERQGHIYVGDKVAIDLRVVSIVVDVGSWNGAPRTRLVTPAGEYGWLDIEMPFKDVFAAWKEVV